MQLNYSLLNSPQGYSLSAGDLLGSLITGFTGVPYAVRHQELGHRWIALLMYCPIIGALAALTERITVSLLQKYYQAKAYTPTPLQPERVKKMEPDQVGKLGKIPTPLLEPLKPLEPPVPPAPEPVKRPPSPREVTECRRYMKGITKTYTLVPAQKRELGRGATSKVHIHATHPEWVVKKAIGVSLADEYAFGVRLRHPMLVAQHGYFVKDFPNGATKDKIVMDRIEGQTINNFYNTGGTLDNDTLGRFILAVADCARYLFEEGVIWGDLNHGNIFITPDKKMVKVIDYERWVTEENRAYRATGLMLGAITILKRLMSVAEIYKGGDRVAESIILPMSFFGTHATLRDPRGLKNLLEQKFFSLEDSQIPAELQSYFDAVIKMLLDSDLNKIAG